MGLHTPALWPSPFLGLSPGAARVVTVHKLTSPRLDPTVQFPPPTLVRTRRVQVRVRVCVGGG